MRVIDYRGLNIPRVSFGAVSSDDLFGPWDQGVFDFYAANANRYRRALDIGANIGVHSILMARQGWQVQAYEPDPEHFSKLESNLASHAIVMIAGQCAVSDHLGAETFVRVCGNTTGSHLKGDKQPYGELEEFEVPVVDCRPLFAWADFAKIDCEGHEARLLLTTTPETRCEFMVEITNRANADAIYKHFAGWRRIYVQRDGWRAVFLADDMPTHHSEGHVFIGKEPPFK